MFLFLRQSTSYPSCVSCLLHAPRCVHSKTDLFWETIEQQISVGLCISLSTDIEDSCLQLVAFQSLGMDRGGPVRSTDFSSQNGAWNWAPKPCCVSHVLQSSHPSYLEKSKLRAAAESIFSCNLRHQGCNMSHQSHTPSCQSYTLSHQSPNLSFQSSNPSHPSFTLSHQSFTLSHQGYTLSRQSHTLSCQSSTLSYQG